MYYLIIAVFGSTTQSGHALTSMQFANRESCGRARAAFLRSLPTEKRGGNTYYTFPGTVRAVCVGV